MVFEPILGLLAGVLGVIVLLEHHILHSFASILQAILQLILQNADIKVCIHPAINIAGIFTPSQPIQPHIIKDPPPNF
ncbi:uncharacterized protein LAESUDRAFT_796108 [Laetiporus sulphureus 93-53]|uniref:Uncharacterized protein n=1 Tax=Laetiporus sulphureus 93-53 TaxID=1314785 RepID=A0A165BS84_9APHY|nr:uncharacterized protein LAESUDRAFT_796108 [Laetiporus sulphureus 93-53]KZT01558.1 hypothetical protein LAESUDRAFT_796108 [Laetiporus sulphureus 93-53]